MEVIQNSPNRIANILQGHQIELQKLKLKPALQPKRININN